MLHENSSSHIDTLFGRNVRLPALLVPGIDRELVQSDCWLYIPMVEGFTSLYKSTPNPPLAPGQRGRSECWAGVSGQIAALIHPTHVCMFEKSHTHTPYMGDIARLVVVSAGREQYRWYLEGFAPPQL